MRFSHTFSFGVVTFQFHGDVWLFISLYPAVVAIDDVIGMKVSLIIEQDVCQQNVHCSSRDKWPCVPHSPQILDDGVPGRDKPFSSSRSVKVCYTVDFGMPCSRVRRCATSRPFGLCSIACLMVSTVSCDVDGRPEGISSQTFSVRWNLLTKSLMVVRVGASVW